MQALGYATTRTRNMSESRQRAPTIFAGSPPKDTKTAFREARSASTGRVRSPDRRPLQRTLSKNLNKTPAPKTSLAPGQVIVTAVAEPTFIYVLASTHSNFGLQPIPGPRVRDKFVSLPVQPDEQADEDLALQQEQNSQALEQLLQVGRACHYTVRAASILLQPPCHLKCLTRRLLSLNLPLAQGREDASQCTVWQKA